MVKYLGLLAVVMSIAMWAVNVNAADCFDRYKIGSSDVLEIIVWREPSISQKEIRVRPDGCISMPLLDDILAAGLSPMELKENIQKKLGTHVKDPSVFVIVRQANSYTFGIMGNIPKPGIYPLAQETTVLQAIAMSGGFSEWAEKDEIVVLRNIGNEQKKYDVDYGEILAGDRPEQNLKIVPGDLIIVP